MAIVATKAIGVGVDIGYSLVLIDSRHSADDVVQIYVSFF